MIALGVMGRGEKVVRKTSAIIRDIVLERVDAIWASLKMDWDFYSQRARIWRQYKAVPTELEPNESGFAPMPAQLVHIFGEEQILDRIETLRLMRLASRHGIEMPSTADNENYREVDFDVDQYQPKYLTPKGFREVRQAIRAAQRERREAAGFWFGVVVGVIGALTGLVSAMG